MSLDPTGPSSADHDVLQLGAIFASDDLAEEHGRFGTYLRPRPSRPVQESYLRRVGLSTSEYQRRASDWTDRPTAWAHFADMARRYAGADAPLASSRILFFDASVEAPFLREGLMRHVDGVKTPRSFQRAGGLVQTCVTLGAQLPGLQPLQDIQEMSGARAMFDHIIDVLGVRCRRFADATRRAHAVRESFRTLFHRLNKYGQSSTSSSRSRSRRQSAPTTRGR